MKKLKEGFTTGACAAAAAKIAVINLISRNLVKSVNVWFPGDKYFKFTAYSVKKSETFSEASVKNLQEMTLILPMVQ